MVREPTHPQLLHDIYIDESSQTNNRYLLLGGLIVPTKHLALLEGAIRQSRLPELPSGELKWTKVSAAKLPAYRRVAESVLVPTIAQLRLVEFHSLVIDTHKLKDKVFNAGSREVGFNKEIYQLCQKFGRINRTAIFHVYLDKRDTKSSTQKLRDILNFGIMAKQNRDWPYRRVHFRDSSDCLCLQVVDVFLGAIAFRLNKHHLAAAASPAKQALSDRILALGSVRDVTRDTSVTGRFTIWHRQLR